MLVIVLNILAKPLEQVGIQLGSGKPRPVPIQDAKNTDAFKVGLYEQGTAFIDAVQFRQLAWPSSDFADHARTLALVEMLEHIDSLPAAMSNE